MKFSQMTYTRPDAESTKQHLAALTEQLKAAKSYEEARKVFLAQQEQAKHISTASTLASVRHSIDTRDTFYDAEGAAANKVDFLAVSYGFGHMDELLKDNPVAIADSPKQIADLLL